MTKKDEYFESKTELRTKFLEMDFMSSRQAIWVSLGRTHSLSFSMNDLLAKSKQNVKRANPLFGLAKTL